MVSPRQDQTPAERGVGETGVRPGCRSRTRGIGTSEPGDGGDDRDICPPGPGDKRVLLTQFLL